MVDLVTRMSPPLARTILVYEQLGLALNRLGRRQEAEAILLKLIAERGPSSETNGILGRVYKDSWQDSRRSGNAAASAGYLRKAISIYLAGFEADWRDAYPGVNAVTLMEMQDPVDPRQAELLPVVHYSVKRRLASKAADYWDYATLLELAVLANNRPEAETALADALTAIREPWEPKTTANNLAMIREKRKERGQDTEWIAGIESQLTRGSGT
jgi:tetratricopeptide (TPR) repeat protein